ncbi:Spy/CpxP family protein refolding chaperone [Ancylobacter lacus]|uniref:Spy/CpxP family protein refolding chaperone n=1 Tax=Ancylobacter lacus TaxID=2579970 RepID=UPI001BCBD35E|nr:Spy/CpxP family protein refolding chaperone [Ancylobacter lacus]MBS7541463.1 Spy/CpxP family protein refolding chaperone [Ancylobacter lacus]
MKRFTRTATLAALLLSTGLGGAAFAQTATKPPVDPATYSSKALERSEARIAKLKASLQLTPDQEKLWPPVESALEAFVKQRIARRTHMLEMHQKGDDEKLDVVARLGYRADAMVTSGEALKTLAAAARPFYDALNPDQQKRFTAIVRRAEQAHAKGDKADKPGAPAAPAASPQP